MKLKFYFYAFTIAYLVLIFVTADSSLGFNVIHLSKKTNEATFTIMPQGWGFFTRNPREPLIDMYKVTSTGLIKVTNPNSSLEYFFGFNRGMRFSSTQIGYFVEQVPERLWLKFAFPNDFFNMDETFFKLINDFSTPIHCGKYILTKTERVPWAWSQHLHEINMPQLLVGIEINCDDSRLDK